MNKRIKYPQYIYKGSPGTESEAVQTLFKVFNENRLKVVLQIEDFNDEYLDIGLKEFMFYDDMNDTGVIKIIVRGKLSEKKEE